MRGKCLHTVILFIMSMLPLCAKAESDVLSITTAAPLPADSALKPLERSREQMWWWNQFRNHTLNLQDTAVVWPKFLKFCVNVYNWADEFFNGTDHDYVVGTGKRWKARVVSDNWVDSYAMRLPKNMPVWMLSNVYSNLGAYIQYMAVSYGYTYDLGNLVGNSSTDHKKMEFGFNCARFNADIYYQENTGGSNIRRFGDFNDRRSFSRRFPGLELKTFGIDAVYYFNNRRFSSGAAYNFSKFQKISQGSWLAGFSYCNLRLELDFTELPSDMIPYLTIPVKNYLIHYDSYALVGGYSYNWVISPKWLYNITVAPSAGITRCYEDSMDGVRLMLSLNIAAKMSLTYNFGNWFVGVIGKMNGHWYKRGDFSIFSSIENFSANIGIRF